MTGPAAEQLLSEHGFSLGHFPQSFEYATIGGFAATRSSGQGFRRVCGRFDDMVRGLRMITRPACWTSGRAPASPPAPICASWSWLPKARSASSRRCACGSTPPATTRYEGVSFPDFATGADALRAVVQTGTGPTVIRLSDEAETGINLATTEHRGTADHRRLPGRHRVRGQRRKHTASQHAETHAVLATAVPRWVRRRRGPGSTAASALQYLRDGLLAAGALLRDPRPPPNGPTFPARLQAAVTAALTDTLADSGTAALVLCHISHVYPTGASLYFTVVAAQRNNPVDQWRAAKRRGVGRDHADRRDHHPSPRRRLSITGRG